MTKKKRVVVFVVAALILGGIGTVVYVKTRPGTEELAVHFLNRCGKGDYAAAEELINSHPELAHCRLDMYEPTLLHVAASDWADTRPLEILLAHNADINAKDNAGRTPLQWALRARNTAAAEYLLTHGGTVGDKAKDTTLRDMIQRLKQQHPDVVIIDRTTKPATEIAE